MTLTYPRHVHRRDGVYRVCDDADTYTAALDAGWVDYPDPSWPAPEMYREWDGSTPSIAPDPVMSPKRGRPRKVAVETTT